ncbi:MAG TPA: alpha/beta fold hydrolase [Chitinophagales bacterium]|nr:alpha/beta fold hydrolase [Chitinophagales bacterium]
MELNYKVFGEIGEDVIIIHGLLGSLDNFQTIAKQLSDTYRVWLLDMRNHGSSFHSDEMNYEVMAKDVHEFMEMHQLSHAHIVGHSMGGKVAMNFALIYPDLVDDLIVVDIGPKEYEGDHQVILRTMLETNLKDYTERRAIENVISEKIHSKKIVQIMMKNLGRNKNDFFWKPNVEVILNSYRLLMSNVPKDSVFKGNTVFIKGENSDYIEVEDLEEFRKYFPEAQMITVPNAGHWVHADQPKVFLQLLNKILNN